MSGSESWSDFSNKAQPLLRAVVNIERRDGAKAMDAIGNAARRLGLTERMARSLLYSEPVRIGREKYQQMLARWWPTWTAKPMRLRRAHKNSERRQKSPALPGHKPSLSWTRHVERHRRAGLPLGIRRGVPVGPDQDREPDDRALPPAADAATSRAVSSVGPRPAGSGRDEEDSVMPEVLFVMLIWASGPNGGPATISGFHTMEACRAAIPVVRDAYWELWTRVNYAACVALPAK